VFPGLAIIVTSSMNGTARAAANPIICSRIPFRGIGIIITRAVEPNLRMNWTLPKTNGVRGISHALADSLLIRLR